MFLFVFWQCFLLKYGLNFVDHFFFAKWKCIWLWCTAFAFIFTKKTMPNFICNYFYIFFVIWIWEKSINILQCKRCSYRHLLGLRYHLNFWGNLVTLNFTSGRKGARRTRGPINAPGKVRVLGYVRLGKIRLG